MDTDEINFRYKLEDRINELYGSAYMFFDWSIKYKNLYNELRPEEIWAKQTYISNDLAKYLILNSNLYLFYSINLIATLLSHKQENIDKKELSLFEQIDYLDENIKINANDNLNILCSYYKESGLDIIRNKIIAHKDIKTSGDPFTHMFNFVNPIFYDKAKEILSKIENYLDSYFFNRIFNNPSKVYFDNSHTIILDFIRNKLSE
jgi:hypothetical protein